MTAMNQAIELSVADGTTMRAYVSAPPRALPAGDPAGTGVIIAHELFAVNPDIRRVADDLAGAGYLTIAPEFYHREAPPGRWLERDAAGREEGFRYLNRLGRRQALDDTAACIGWLNSQPSIERIAMIGFSAGGHLSYLAACRLPVSATAVLYGGWLPTTDIPMSQPSPTLDLTPGIRGRILYLVGDEDALIDAGQRRQIGDALRAAGTDHEMISYPGAAHAFFWSGTPAFNQAARDDAWSRIIAMLAALRPEIGRPLNGTIGDMDVDPDRFAALLAARLAAIVPDGFHVTLEDDMLWFRSDEGRFPGQQGDYHTGSSGIWPQEDFLTCVEHQGTAEDCVADAARHALDALQDYIAEATHDPWPGQRTMPEPHAQVQGSTLHLWYGAADDPVLACEPMPLG